MSRVVATFDKHTDHVLIHTGQNYAHELNQVFFDDLGIRSPDRYLDAAGATTAQTIARVIERADEALAEVAPDALLIYGDTNSCLAVIAAKRRKIPVFHMEAGNRCFDQRVPEELNRKVVDHLSDVNMVLSEHARRYLLAEGLPADRIFKTGSHMPEVLAHVSPKIEKSDVLSRLGLEPKRYFVVSAHREENVDAPERLHALLETLKAIHASFGLSVLVSTHPRTRKRLDALANTPEIEGVKFMPAFGFVDYIRLQREALCVLSDSGTITEEAALLGLPAVTLRQTHERPEGMDEAVLVMSDLEPARALEATRTVIAQHENGFSPRPVVDYDAGVVSEKVLRIVLSYTDYVNRVVWRR